MSESILPIFSSRSFIVSGLTLRSSIHFTFIFVYGIRKYSSFILLQVVDQFSQHHLLKRLSFLHCRFLGGSFNKERNLHTRLAVFGSCKMNISPLLPALHRHSNGVQSHIHSSVQRCSVTQLCPTLCDPTRLLCPWDSPGKNTGVDCHLL